MATLTISPWILALQGVPQPLLSSLGVYPARRKSKADTLPSKRKRPTGKPISLKCSKPKPLQHFSKVPYLRTPSKIGNNLALSFLNFWAKIPAKILAKIPPKVWFPWVWREKHSTQAFFSQTFRAPPSKNPSKKSLGFEVLRTLLRTFSKAISRTF